MQREFLNEFIREVDLDPLAARDLIRNCLVQWEYTHKAGEELLDIATFKSILRAEKAAEDAAYAALRAEWWRASEDKEYNRDDLKLALARLNKRRWDAQQLELFSENLIIERADAAWEKEFAQWRKDHAKELAEMD